MCGGKIRQDNTGPIILFGLSRMLLDVLRLAMCMRFWDSGNCGGRRSFGLGGTE
jgi:hypothetical protein